MYSKKIKTKRLTTRSGFTLTELLVVIAIIGLLSGVATVGMRAYLASSRTRVAKIEMSEITNALENYNSIKSTYPSTDQGLQVLGQSTAEFPGGLLEGNLADPWGNPYEYVVPGTDGEPFEIICSGADGRIGTADDLTSIQLDE